MRIELVTEIGGKVVTGLTEMKELAESGNIEALNLLGEWMMMGFECSPDPQFYVSCFKEAARKGNTQAMLNLAVCYMEERGVKADFYAARRWIRAALEGGDGEAILLFSELYLTTIGNHKPDVHEYVETLYEFDPSGKMIMEEMQESFGWLKSFFLSKDDIKKRLYAHLILSARGKSVGEIKRLRNKVTENDIQGYARLNDIHHSETEIEKSKRDVTEEKQRCALAIEQAIGKADRAELIYLLRAIYKLGKKESIQPKIYDAFFRARKIETTEIAKVKELLASSLTWKIKAFYEIDNILYNSFDSQWVQKNIDVILCRLDEVEDCEIKEQYEDALNDWRKLQSVHKKIREAKYYSSKVVGRWERKITDSIVGLQEKEVEQRFNVSLKNYNEIVKLYNFVNEKVVYERVRETWALRLKKTAIELQKNELEKCCRNLKNKPLKDLYVLKEQIKEYSFDPKVLDGYNKQLTDAIEKVQHKEIEEKLNRTRNKYDELILLNQEIAESSEYLTCVKTEWRNKINCVIKTVQKEELGKIISSVDKLEYSALIKLREKAKAYSYHQKIFDDAIKPVDIRIDELEKMHMENLCSNISTYNVAKLRLVLEEIKALQYRDKNSQMYLERINSAINGKDLLERCSTSCICNYAIDQLDDLMREVHFSSLANQEKKEIFTRINQQKELIDECDEKIKELQKKSQKLLAEYVRKELDKLGEGISTEITRIYSESAKLQKAISHLTKKNWDVDEVALAYLNVGGKVGIDMLLTNKAVRNYYMVVAYEDCLCTNVSGKCNCLELGYVSKSNRQGSLLHLGNGDNRWTYEGARHMSSIFDGILRKLAAENAVLRTEIQSLKNQYANKATLQQTDTKTPFEAFCRQYRPEKIIGFPTEKMDGIKLAIQQSSLTDVEKDFFIYLLDEVELLSHLADGEPAVYATEYHKYLCRWMLRSFRENISVSAKEYCINERETFSKFLDAFKKEEIPYYDEDEERSNEVRREGLFAYKCAKKGALVIFGKTFFLFHSGHDFTHDHYSRWHDYESIERFSYSKKGFFDAPIMWLHYDCGTDTWINLPGCSADRAKALVTFCNNALAFMKKERENANLRDQDLQSVQKYFAKMKQVLVVELGEKIDSIVQGGKVLTKDDLTSFKTVWLKSKLEYYKQHPLQLHNQYYSLDSKIAELNGGLRQSGNTEVSGSQLREVAKPVVSQKQVDHSQTLEEKVKTLMRQEKKLEAVKVVRETTGMGLADAKAYVEKLVPQQNIVTKTENKSVSIWLCTCGKVGKGNFCTVCGTKKETGIPLWICTCGSVNKGKFCSKCGSKKKED